MIDMTNLDNRTTNYTSRCNTCVRLLVAMKKITKHGKKKKRKERKYLGPFFMSEWPMKPSMVCLVVVDC